eukprot:30845-Pelagococcus_subviridis.AAC.17
MCRRRFRFAACARSEDGDRNGRRATETATRIGRDPRGADPSERLENDLLERKRNGACSSTTTRSERACSRRIVFFSFFSSRPENFGTSRAENERRDLTRERVKPRRASRARAAKRRTSSEDRARDRRRVAMASARVRS